MSGLLAILDEPSLTLAQRGLGPRGGAGSSVGGMEASPLFLVNVIAPIIAMALFLGWAWVVATIYDKDAERFYLKRKEWNMAHIGAAGVALIALIASPMWFIGFPIFVVVLGADLIAYYSYHNKADRVPDSQTWSLKSMVDFKANKDSKKDAKLARGVTLEFNGPNGLVRAPQKNTPEFEIRVAAESVIIDAIERRAADVEIAPANENAAGVIFVVDGVPHQGEAMTLAQANGVINFLKQAAGLQVEDARRKQQGDIKVGQGDSKRIMRVVASGSSSGMRVMLRFDPEKRAVLTVDQLGLLENQQEEFQKIADDCRGVVLISAPPRQGRTVTLYAAVRAHDAYISNIQTIELEPAGAIEGVRHNKFDPTKEGPDYATQLRSIMRRDPTVVMVGEFTDEATAKEIIRADAERIRTYVGLRADSALAAIQVFAKAVGDAKKTANCLHGVSCQRLVRKLCQNCRVEYQPTPDMLKKLGVPAEKAPASLFRKGGKVMAKNKEEVCPMCQGTGYFGQEGVFEIYEIGREERALLATGDLAGLRTALNRKRLPSIQAAAVRKVLAGVTSVEEVVRITSSGKSSGRSSSSKKPSAPAAGAPAN
jgi:general secretion pathway protein E